jgi:GT2 family glycosyltransferase
MRSGKPRATIVISTKNRVDDLRTTLASIRGQSEPVEVIVMDDGSTDGTDNMVRCDYPEVRLVRSEESRGYIVRRNEGARLATTPFIISLDDDAILTGRDTVSRTLAEFDHPRIGAVAMPFINVREDTVVRCRAPDDRETWVLEGFVGTAHALRRDLFLSLGGYREVLFHQGEEQDFSIRLLQAGYAVRAGSAQPIHHLQSPARSRKRMVVYTARNNILFVWHNVPASRLPVHLGGTIIRLLQFGVRDRHPIWVMEGIARGVGRVFREFRQRRPVSVGTYRLLRTLRRQGALTLASVDRQLPPIS